VSTVVADKKDERVREVPTPVNGEPAVWADNAWNKRG
jgi:hypothetical protein